MRLVKWLLQELFEVFRWREEWTFFDWIGKTLAGKTVVTGAAAIMTVILAALSQHPLITSAATGALVTSLLILVWDYLVNRGAKRRQIETGGDFEQFSPSSSIGPISAELADLEHHWGQCRRAYQAIQDSWNLMFREARVIRARKELSSDEQTKLSDERIDTGLNRVFQATIVLVARVHQLDEFVGAHFSDWR